MPILTTDRPVYVAAVQTTDGIRHLTVAQSPAELDARIAHYVAGNAERLWPADTERVQSLLTTGNVDQAIETYFRTIGARWDEETLIIQEVAEHDGTWTTSVA